MNRTLTSVIKVLAALTTLFTSFVAMAQAYPAKPITLVVPWATGGPVDVIARAIATGIAPRLKQPLVVDNKPGASGRIGAEFAAKSAPDGYTILVASADTNVLNPLVFSSIRYKPADFEPIVDVASIPTVLVIRSNLQVRSLGDLVTMARQKPNALTYGSWGTGSLGHASLAMLEQEARIQMTHAPYKGAAPALTDLLGGHIDLMIATGAWAENEEKAGRVRIIGTPSPTRSPLFPKVPTMAEQGYPGFVAQQWVALFGPKGLPVAIRDQLNAAVNEWLNSDQARSFFKDNSADIVGGSSAQLLDRQRREMERWDKVIKDKNIRIDE